MGNLCARRTMNYESTLQAASSHKYNYQFITFPLCSEYNTIQPFPHFFVSIRGTKLRVLCQHFVFEGVSSVTLSIFVLFICFSVSDIYIFMIP